MYLTRLELTDDAARHPAFWRGVSSDEGAHHAIWRLFRRSPEQRRDFLFRKEDSPLGRIGYFVLSDEPPVGDDEGMWRVEVKPFEPRLEAGQRLRFMLRASPTVRRTAEGGKSGRHDLVMDAKRRTPADEDFDVVRTATAEGARWLGRQGMAAGFRLDTDAAMSLDGDGLLEDVESPMLRVEGYRQHRVPRRGAPPIRFSSVDFEGVLVVEEPERFLHHVARGFGPQKAFGCGLMLLRRA